MAIAVLPSHVVDQIAAGEVVERPAQLVKELVENSLDAGASEIEVEFDEGGRRVRVSDNGVGIGADDLPMALARHATSKIRKTQDLWHLHSFGFRGEALATIAAVSRLSLTSRPPESPIARRIESQFGQVGAVVETGGEPGTQVMVQDLFGNVPARLKFLKSESAETQQIRQTLKALALSHPEVGFRVRSAGRLLHYFPAAASRRVRAEQVLELETLYDGAAEMDGLRVEVAIASPHLTSTHRRQIWLFAQDRWIQDKGLSAAVVDAYRGLLMHGEFPFAVIWLWCHPQEIDVNVHPTKSQVKFLKPSDAYRAVHRAVRSTLEAAPWLRRDEVSAPVAAPVATVPPTEPPKPTGSPRLDVTPTPVPLAFSFEPSSTERLREPEVEYRVTNQAPAVPGKTRGPWSRLEVLGQAHRTYIIAQEDRGVLFIDQHAAHERVLYERLLLAWETGEREVQSLLLPISVELGTHELERVLSCTAELLHAGFTVDQLGPTTLLVRTLPAMLKDAAVAPFFSELGHELVENGGSQALPKLWGRLAATMACHSAVRAGQVLDREQMRQLLQQMDEFPLSSFCPHGRPVSIEFSLSHLEREFGRVT